MADLINRERSVIPACDVDVKRFEDIVRETHSIDGIGAYKIGAALALSEGLPRIVERARKYTTKPLIYDHQKASTDIPETGRAFASAVKCAGIDAVILFPLTGPRTQEAWIESALDEGLTVITGGHMTHEMYVVSEGGYIDDKCIEKMFVNSATHRVSDYVVPGNKPDAISRIRNWLLAHNVEPTFYAPGFIRQGGAISDAAKVAGPRWHAIVGRAIYEALDIAKEADSLASCI